MSLYFGFFTKLKTFKKLLISQFSAKMKVSLTSMEILRDSKRKPSNFVLPQITVGFLRLV